MKPVLYESQERDFTNNGVGILGDVISCTVTQERNGAYELTMEYPMEGIHYDSLSLRSIVMAPPDRISDPQPFRVYEISRPIGGVVTVYGRHIAYDLMGIPVAPFQATSASGAMAALPSAAVVPCPFMFWTDKTTVATMDVTVPHDIWGLLGGTAGGILDVYGGEYEFDRWTVKLHQERGYNRGVTIRYGKNLSDLEQDENCEAVYTGIYPYWKDSEGNLVELGEKIVNASGTFDFTRIQPVDFSQEWQEAPTQEQLKTRAKRYVTENKIGVPKVSLDVSFVPLEQTEEYKELAVLQQVGLCDTVTVEFPRLGVYATAKCISVTYNCLTERYDRIKLGAAKSSFVDTIIAQGQEISKKPEESFMRKAIATLTASILGAKGGSVRLLDTDGDGEPDTLYIADHPDPEQARKVWRFNYEGWGASENGYNGPFTLGASFESGILADFITAGTLRAGLIKAGVLSDVKGLNYWNMDTGAFQLSATTTVGGKTVGSVADDAVSEYDNTLNQDKVFQRLTNYGTTKGIIMEDGQLYINASYLNSGRISATDVTLGGKLAVYNGNAMGGYVGYMEGATSDGITVGIGVSNTTGDCYSIATEAGARLQGGENYVVATKENGVAIHSDTGVYITGPLYHRDSVSSGFTEIY